MDYLFLENSEKRYVNDKIGPNIKAVINACPNLKLLCISILNVKIIDRKYMDNITYSDIVNTPRLILLLQTYKNKSEYTIVKIMDYLFLEKDYNP